MLTVHRVWWIVQAIPTRNPSCCSSKVNWNSWALHNHLSVDPKNALFFSNSSLSRLHGKLFLKWRGSFENNSWYGTVASCSKEKEKNKFCWGSTRPSCQLKLLSGSWPVSWIHSYESSDFSAFEMLLYLCWWAAEIGNSVPDVKILSVVLCSECHSLFP